MLVKNLPALNNPTVANLLDKNWVAIAIIVDERAVRDIIPKFKKLGGIIEYPRNKVIYHLIPMTDITRIPVC